MRFAFSALRLPAGLRAKALTLILGVALGAAALSLGDCTCTDGSGQEIACPYAYD